MKSLRVFALAAAGLGWTVLTCLGVDAPVATEGDTVQLPDMVVTPGYSLKDFPFPTKTELAEADLLSGSAPPDITYPGRAFTDGVFAGRATVGMMLDAKGHPTDYLIVRYTRTYFGEAVLTEAKKLKYAPRRLLGTVVPGSYHFTYEFRAPAGTSNLNSFDAMNRRLEQVSGGPKFIYEPHRENETDAGQLEPVHMVIPMMPAGFTPADGRPVRVLVTFYVDETGRVRLPNVESSLAPALVPTAIAALQQWSFKPATVKGQPVLVHVTRALTFRPAGAP